MNTMVSYNIIAFLVIAVSVFCFIAAKRSSMYKWLRLILEIIFIIVIGGTVLTIAFLDMIAFGIIGLVPN